MTLSEVFCYSIILVSIYAFIQFFFYKKHNGNDFNSYIHTKSGEMLSVYNIFIESVASFTRL